MANNRGDEVGEATGILDGRVIAGRFRIVEVVSSGANTIIADAIDDETSQPVTVKVVRPELAASDEFRRAFRRHAEVATALTHPNIATVIAWGEVELDGFSSVFWVVEYLSGGSLRDLSDRGRLLAPSQALVIGLEACRALDVAHQRGIVHTELTPSKMVFGDDRRVRIVDFGIARLLGEALWADPAHVPTHVARYSSPEQALGIEVDATTDVYALVLSLIEAVTGSVPFAAESTVATLAARIGRLMPVSADLGSLAAVLERGGRPEAEDRSTAAELGQGLVQAASTLPRPEPIPIVAGGLFATADLRRPTDPTGGLARPDADEGAAQLVVEPDEPVVADTVEPVVAGSDEPVVEPVELVVVDTVEPMVADTDEPMVVDTVEPMVVDTVEPMVAESDTPMVAESDEPMAVDPVVESGEPVVVADNGADPGPADGDGDNAEDPADDGVEPASAVPTTAAAAATPDESPQDGSAGEAAAIAGAVVAGGAALASADTSASARADAAEVATGPAADEPVLNEPVANEPQAEPANVAAATDESDGESDGEPAAGPEPLILLTDVADPPTGAVEVGAGDDPGPDDPSPAGVGATTEVVSGDSTAVLPVEPLSDTPTMYDEERPRRRVGKILALTLVVLVGLAGLGYAGWLLLRTKSYEVPDLAGVSEEVALNEISGNDWLVTIERERNDAEPTIDNVIRTSPGPGVTLDEGEGFLMVVSDGPELRTLAEITDFSILQAEGQLLDQRLVPLIEVREFSETVPLDAVISWRVQGDDGAGAGSQILPDTTILLTVSDGPAPRSVPALTDQTLATATTEIEALRLVLVRGDDVFSDDFEVGQIVFQDPAPGTSIPRGGSVTVQLSKGPDVVALPDLTGLTYAQAETLLLDTGFTIGNLLGTTDGTFVSLTINGESVEVGTLFRRGTAVDVIFL